MLEIDEEGNRFWYNKKHQWNRVDGPAYEGVNGTKCWWVNGERHRIDGPAVERDNGIKCWYKNGKRHREDGPAVEYSSGIKKWYLNGTQYTEVQYKKKVSRIC